MKKKSSVEEILFIAEHLNRDISPQEAAMKLNISVAKVHGIAASLRKQGYDLPKKHTKAEYSSALMALKAKFPERFKKNQ